MSTAFVLSGGASLAAVQVGMMQALLERGVRPDLLVGTSAGALNAAYVAGHGYSAESLARLADLWIGMRRSSIFPFRGPRAAMAAVGLRDALFGPERLAELVRRELPFRRIEEAALPVHLVAADVLSGREAILSDGDVVTALLASCAIPGIFPAVEVGDLLLCDGALADSSGIAHAASLDVERVYLLPGGTACALDRAPRHPLAAGLHAVTLLLAQREHLETRVYAGQVELHVLPPLCPLTVSSADFGQARQLIGRALTSSREWLEAGRDLAPHPERFLTLHDHRRPSAPPVRGIPASTRGQ